MFALWSSALGLALKDDVTALEVSRWVEGAVARALLVESPEPLDFTQEIAATLTARVPGGPGQPVAPQPLPLPLPPGAVGGVRPLPLPPGAVGGVRPLPLPPGAVGGVRPLPLPPGAAGGVRPLPLPPGAVGGVRPLIDRLQQVASQGARPLVPLPGLPPVDQTILDVETIDGDVRLWLHPALANAGMLAVVVIGAGGQADLFRGLVRPPFLSGNPAILQADPVGPLGQLPAGSDLVAELAGAQPGAVLLASNDLVDLLGRWGGQALEVDVDIDVQIIQNGDGRRALVIPVIGIATPGFANAPHRLTLSLSRDRWETTDAPDELNSYVRSATLSLDL